MTVHATFTGEKFHLYDLSQHEIGTPLAPALTIEGPPLTERVQGYAAHPGLRGIAYATETELVRLDATGEVLWRLEIGPPVPRAQVGRVGVTFACGGDRLWLYIANAMMERADHDCLLVVDAAGTAIAKATLETVGEGADLIELPDGHVLIDIGEGQDGGELLRAGLDGDNLVMTTYPYADRLLIDVSPDGSTFMCVGDHDVAFSSYPDGDVLFTLNLADFGEDREDTCVEATGGYVAPRTAVVVLSGQDEDTEEDWYRHYLVDLDSHAVTGQLATPAYLGEIKPLGDGTWLQPGIGGRLERHSR